MKQHQSFQAEGWAFYLEWLLIIFQTLHRSLGRKPVTIPAWSVEIPQRLCSEFLMINVSEWATRPVQWIWNQWLPEAVHHLCAHWVLRIPSSANKQIIFPGEKLQLQTRGGLSGVFTAFPNIHVSFRYDADSRLAIGSVTYWKGRHHTPEQNRTCCLTCSRMLVFR